MESPLRTLVLSLNRKMQYRIRYPLRRFDGAEGIFLFSGGDQLENGVYRKSPAWGLRHQHKNAVEYCRIASKQGVLPLAPHIIFSQWCNDTIPEQREQGLQLGLSLLQKSDELWVMGTEFSQGMQGEMAFALEHKIPMFFVTHPHDPNYYPISADENRILTSLDCTPGSDRENYEGQLVVLRHEHLKPEYRTPRNQIWAVTHGPGCHPYYPHSDTIHLKHPIDGDRMAVARGDVWGVAKVESLTRISNTYPEFESVLSHCFLSDAETCR